MASNARLPRLLILALGMFAIGTDSYVIAGILPQVARSFDVTTSMAGQLVTVYSLAYAVLTPVLAALTAHWRRERVLVTGLVVFVAGNLLTATQVTFALALVSRGVAGAGAAMFSPAAGAAAASLVRPEQRGRALAIVLAGLSGATALGAPIGTLVAGGGDWRSTMWLVAAVGVATLGLIAALLRALPVVAVPPLRDRLAPIADARVALTLTTTLLAMLGVFLVYTYISVVFDRAIDNDSTRLAAMLSMWGVAATAGNLASGHVTDRFGNRRVIAVTVAVAAIDFAVMPWSSATFGSALVALAIWGACGWALVVAQQHRLVAIRPALAPVLLALNSAAVYIGVSASGAIGGAAIRVVDPHALPAIGACLLAAALVTAELAHRRMPTVSPGPHTRPTMEEIEETSDPRLWKKAGWVARIIKNENDEGWAASMTRAGDSEPVLISPWTMGRDKVNPKPLDHAGFATLLKGATEVLRRHEQALHARMHRSGTCTGADGTRLRADLDIQPDEDDPHAILSVFDERTSELLRRGRVAGSFKLTEASVQKFLRTGGDPG